MTYITVSGERIFVVRRSPPVPQGPAVIFSHGAGGTHRHWLPELMAAGEVTQAYALDLPGHGRSEGHGCDAIAGYVSVVVGLLDALALDRVVVGGHSMGGAIAQTFALTHPDRCAGLILTGTGARLRVLPAILEGVLDDLESTVGLVGAYAYGPNAPADLLRLGREEMLRNDPRVFHGDFVACDRFDIMDRLGEIQVPTLILCGTADQLTPPKYSRYLHEHIPNSTLTLVEGAGHMVMLEDPGEMNEAIIEFLQNLTPDLHQEEP